MILVSLTDSSFINARGLKSQFLFVILMMDETYSSNIIHFGSSRWRRGTRSVMESKIHALILGFDNAYALKHMLEVISKLKVILESYIYRKTLFVLSLKDS